MPLSAFAVVACGGSSDSTGADQDTVPFVKTATERGAVLALACTGCHAQDSGAIVSLNNYSTEQLRDALQQYKLETDGTTVMHRLARGYSDDDIALVSAYLEQAEAD